MPCREEEEEKEDEEEEEEEGEGRAVPCCAVLYRAMSCRAVLGTKKQNYKPSNRSLLPPRFVVRLSLDVAARSLIESLSLRNSPLHRGRSRVGKQTR